MTSKINDVFKSIHTTIIKNIQKSSGKVSGWIIVSVIDHTISISKYNHLAERSYIKLPKELDNPRKSLSSIHECLKWCLDRYLNHADHHPARITKADEDIETQNVQ